MHKALLGSDRWLLYASSYLPGGYSASMVPLFETVPRVDSRAGWRYNNRVLLVMP
jgi:hypothetical protein